MKEMVSFMLKQTKCSKMTYFSYKSIFILKKSEFGTEPDKITKNNGDKKIGLEEAVYVSQCVVAMR